MDFLSAKFVFVKFCGIIVTITGICPPMKNSLHFVVFNNTSWSRPLSYKVFSQKWVHFVTENKRRQYFWTLWDLSLTRLHLDAKSGSMTSSQIRRQVHSPCHRLRLDSNNCGVNNSLNNHVYELHEMKTWKDEMIVHWLFTNEPVRLKVLFCSQLESDFSLNEILRFPCHVYAVLGRW